MNNKIVFGFFALMIVPFVVAAVSQSISYPIPELGNCGSEEECKTYCDNVENLEKCIEFAEENDLMSKEELEQAKKVLPYLLSGETPGGCKGKEECDAYCRKEENLEECIEFALKIGDISEEEAEMARKVGGKGPGGCRGPVECDAYCNKDENMMECVEFAYQHGMIDEEEYEIIKKTGGKGPGGCKGEEECEDYCKEHEEECMKFAEEYGLMPKEDVRRGEMSKEEECMFKCISESGIDPRECRPGPEGEAGGSACRSCAEKCVQFYEGPCLTEEQWREKERECMSKGEHMEAKPIMGDSGQEGKGECAIDIECIDRSDEWGDMPGEGPGIGDEGWTPPEEWSEEQGGPGKENIKDYEKYVASNQEGSVEEETEENTDNSGSNMVSEDSGEETNTDSGEPETEASSGITAEVILTGKVVQDYKPKSIKMIFR